MENISSSTSCFDLALDFLDGLEENESRRIRRKDLMKDLRILQTFDLYLSKCRKRNNDICSEQDGMIKEQKNDDGMIKEQKKDDVISFRIQDLINRGMQDLKRSQDRLTIDGRLVRFGKAVKLFFKTEIKEYWRVNFLLDGYYRLRDPSLVIDFIDSVSKHLAGFYYVSSDIITLESKLMFLKSVIRFAMLCRLVEAQQLRDLSIHAEVVAIDVLTLIHVCRFDLDDEIVSRLTLLKKIKHYVSDPQVRETCIGVLTAAKLGSRLSDTSVLEKDQRLGADLMDCLVRIITEVLQSPAAILVSITDQVIKLLGGLRFLIDLLKHHELFSKLCHGMKNLIGVVVCDAVIFSISVYQYAEEDLAEETDLALLRLLVELEFVRAEVAHVYPPVISVGFGFPKTNELGTLDFLLKNLKELAMCGEIDGSIAVPVENIQTIQRDLKFLRSSVEKIQKQRNQNQKLLAFWSRVMEVAYRAELVIDLRLVGDWVERCLDDVARDINLLKIEAQEISTSISYDGEIYRATKTVTRIPSQVHDAVAQGEGLVGLDSEVEAIVQRLTRGSNKLDVVPIVGMPGLGKTTLANKVYNAPLIISHFHIRAWGTVSQVYSMQKLYVEILCCIESENSNKYKKMQEEDLAAKVKQVLLRNKYLLVLDDLWDTEVWNLLARSLPDDAKGSRILITSRIQNLFHEQNSYHLRHLTNDESWKLLQKKLFGNKDCPANLTGIGYQVAESCKGLPLTVILVAGILAPTEGDFEVWEEVAESLSSKVVLDDEHCMSTLELSYSHLPDDLKQCLLYFGSFQEDQNIVVRRLLWLWISEGFVQQTTEGKSLEDVADDYLNALVDRSLIMVSKKRTLGGAKACGLHDLVHEFCVRKGKEENFLHNIHSWEDPCILTGPSNPHRVCDQNVRNLRIGEIMQFFPNLRSLLLFNADDLGFWLPKLLRVLDFRNLELYDFPVEVVLLVHLRYLALYLNNGIKPIPCAIANLSRLQTFFLRGLSNFWLPESIWNMKTLRHLLISNSNCGFVFPAEDLEASTCLDNLHSLSLAIDPSSHCLQKILKKLPNIRRLKCVNATSRASTTVLVFDDLSKLESLRLARLFGGGFRFPRNLKKLTLSYNDQPWSGISSIGDLPDLVVLKLLYRSFNGEEWELKDGDFPSLRFLKLYGLDLRNWSASSGNLPCLEKLVMSCCERLEEVPTSCLEECPMLEMIEVFRCRESAASSVKQVQQEQIEWGNENMKIVIQKCHHGVS